MNRKAIQLPTPREASRKPIALSGYPLKSCNRLGRGFAWFDTGTHDSLVDASAYIQTIERRQSLRIAVPEEIAFSNGWIDREQLAALGKAMEKNGYGQYLLWLAQDKDGALLV